MTAPDVTADVRARFEAWLKRNGIEIFPNWRDDDWAVVSVGKLMQLAALAKHTHQEKNDVLP